MFLKLNELFYMYKLLRIFIVILAYYVFNVELLSINIICTSTNIKYYYYHIICIIYKYYLQI